VNLVLVDAKTFGELGGLYGREMVRWLSTETNRDTVTSQDGQLQKTRSRGGDCDLETVD
jgi:hypothetical protein